MEQDLSQRADPEEVERLVGGMMHALQEKEFRGADGLSAALTFVYRLAKALIALTVTEEAKRNNLAAIVLSMRRVAAMLEMEYETSKNERVH